MQVIIVSFLPVVNQVHIIVLASGSLSSLKSQCGAGSSEDLIANPDPRLLQKETADLYLGRKTSIFVYFCRKICHPDPGPNSGGGFDVDPGSKNC